MQTQQDAQNGKIDQVSGQIQSLNDSVDELKARLTAWRRRCRTSRAQQQSINATLQNGAAGRTGGCPSHWQPRSRRRCPAARPLAPLPQSPPTTPLP